MPPSLQLCIDRFNRPRGMLRPIAFLLGALSAAQSYGNPFVDALQRPSRDAPSSGFYYELVVKCGADSSYLQLLRSRQEVEFHKSAGTSEHSKQDFAAQFDAGRAEALSLWNSKKFQSEAKVVVCKTVQAVAGGTFLSNPNGAAAPSRAVYNAVWNDSGAAGAISFWLYASEGTCTAIRKANPNVIAISPVSEIAGNSAALPSTKSLSYCMLLAEHSQVVECKSGSLQYTYVPTSHEYVGNYSLEFVDGSSRSGEFAAQFCPERE